jgi:hypothetical protein
MTATVTPGMGDRSLTASGGAQALSFPGMAHFAGTCVANRNAKCTACAYMVERAQAKGVKVGACALYKTRTKDRVPRKFPIGTSACKYFQPMTKR